MNEYTKKKMWSEKEIQDEITRHEKRSLSHNSFVGIVVLIILIITLVSSAVMWNEFDGAGWQPINCVNETVEIRWMCLTDDCGISMRTTLDECPQCKTRVEYVPTGRQNCPQEIYIRNRTRVL